MERYDSGVTRITYQIVAMAGSKQAIRRLKEEKKGIRRNDTKRLTCAGSSALELTRHDKNVFCMVFLLGKSHIVTIKS